MFQHFVNVCRSNGLDLQISAIHLDFEEAVHDAVKWLWPDEAIRGCHLYLSQARWRKIQASGLACEYKNQDSGVGKWLRSFFGLSFLKPEEIEDCFAFDIWSSPHDDDRLDGLFELCGIDNDCMCIYHEFDFWSLDFNVSFMYAYQLNMN